MTISVSLDTAQWNVVMAAVAEAPWKIANPIIGEIVRALEQSKQPVLPPDNGPPPSLLGPPSPPTAFEKLKDQLR
jgi:hypothetical protein